MRRRAPTSSSRRRLRRSPRPRAAPRRRRRRAGFCGSCRASFLLRGARRGVGGVGGRGGGRSGRRGRDGRRGRGGRRRGGRGGRGRLAAVVRGDLVDVGVREVRRDRAHGGEIAVAAAVLLQRGDDVAGLLAAQLGDVIDLG